MGNNFIGITNSITTNVLQQQQQQQQELLNTAKKRLVELGYSQEQLDKFTVIINPKDSDEVKTQKQELQAKRNEALLKFAYKKGVISEGKIAETFGASFKNTITAEVSDEEKAKIAGRRQSYENKLFEIQEAKDLAKAQEKFEKLQAETKAARQEMNRVDKKTLKKTIKDANGNKVKKEDARFAAEVKHRELSDNLVIARTELDALKEKYGEDKVNQINRFNRERAEELDNALGFEKNDRTSSQKAADREVNDFFNTDKGKKAVIAEQRKLQNMTQKEVRDAMRNNDGKTVNQGFNPFYGGTLKGRGRKNADHTERQMAVEKIIIGDKDKYKAEKKNDTNGNPTVTFLTQKQYNKAIEIAKSQGVELPAKAKELTEDDLRKLQQVMVDAAGGFGSRLDLSERYAMKDEFKAGFQTIRKISEAVGVDVQKGHKNVAAVVGAGLAIAGSVWANALDKAYPITEPGGQEWVEGTKIQEWIRDPKTQASHLVTKETPGYWKKLDDIIKFIKDNDSAKVLLGALSAEALIPLILMIADHEPDLLRNNKTLADAVYDQAAKALKFETPNARKVMQKYFELDNITKEQKLAILQKAMGNKGKKLNPRELAAAMTAAIAAGGKDGLGTIDKVDLHEDVKTDNKDRVAYDTNGDKDDFIDAEGNKVNLDNARDEYGNKIIKDGALATSYDSKTLANNNVTIDRNATMEINNEGKLNELNNPTAKAQYTSANEHNQTRITGNPLRPTTIEMDDDVNHNDGKVNTHKFEFVEEKDGKVYYKLVEVTVPGPEGKPVALKSTAVGKLYVLNTDKLENDKGTFTETIAQKDELGMTTEEITYKTKVSQLTYHLDAEDGKSSAKYSDVNPNVKKK